MKNICFVAPFAGPPFNEAWRNNVKLLSAELDAVVLASCEGKDNLHDTPSNYQSVVHKNKYIRYLIHALYSWWKTKDSQLVFVEVRPYTLHFLFLVMLLNLNKCVFRIINSGELLNVDSLLKRLFVRYISKKFKKIIAIDERSKNDFSVRSGLMDNILILKPGIDINGFKPTPPPKNSEFNILMASSPCKAGSNGGNWESAFQDKGIIVLLNIIKAISKNNRIKLNLIWRQDYTVEIDNIITKMGLDNVEVIHGFVDMYKYYKENDAVILPALSQISTPAYPNSIMESIAVGRPVIVSKELSICKVIEDGGCGIAVDPNEKEIIAAIENMILNYDGFQSRCLSVAQNYFDFHKNVGQLKKSLLIGNKLV